MHFLLQSVPHIQSRTDSTNNKEYNGEENIRNVPRSEKDVMGWGILDKRLLHWDSRGARKRSNNKNTLRIKGEVLTNIKKYMKGNNLGCFHIRIKVRNTAGLALRMFIIFLKIIKGAGRICL